MDELNDRFRKSAEDFSLIPSSGIWQNVERDIRRRERKRRIIIFFFLFAIILGSGIFLLSNYPVHSGSKISLQTTHGRASEPYKIQRSTRSVKRNIAVGNSSAIRSFPEKKEQEIQHEIATPAKQFSNTFSSNEIEKGSVSVTQRNSKQDDITVNQSQEIRGDTVIANAIPPIESGSTESSLSDIMLKDSVRIESKKEPVMVTNPDSLSQDDLTAKKDTIKAATHHGKWSISIGIAPAISYTKFDEDGDYRLIANYRESTDKNLLEWNYHFAVTYQVIPEFEVFIGTGLINYAEQMLSKEAVYHYDTAVLTGPNPVPTITIGKSYFNINNDSTGTVKNKFSWLEIPVGISCNFLADRKLNISLKPGISFNKLLHAEGYKYNYQNLSYEKIADADLRSWLVAYSIGLSFQYAVINNLKIKITPCYNGFQKSIYITSYPLGQSFQQTELQLSICYLLK